MAKTDIGQNVAFYRKKRGLTQKKLAEKMGISPNLISHYEIGRLRISAEMLYDFAQAMNISADKLLGLDEKPYNNQLSLKVARRMNQIEKLELSDQKILLSTIDRYLKGSTT